MRLRRRARQSLREVLVGGAILLLSVGGGSFLMRGSLPPPMERLSIGVAPSPAAALIAVAERQGYFAKHDLRVTMQEYETGRETLLDLDAGLDLGTASDIALREDAGRRSDWRILAALARGGAHDLVAQRSRGIETPEDLQGKHIAYSRGTSGEYYLAAFLQRHGVPWDATVPVDLSPSVLPAALAAGEVDAAIGRDVFAFRMQEELGDEAAIWPAQEGEGPFLLLIALRQTVEERPKALAAFLSALTEAEAFAAEHPAEARRILQERWSFPPEWLEAFWPRLRLAVSLDTSLLAALEAVNATPPAAGRLSEAPQPDLPALIAPKILKSVDPARVRLAR